MTEHISKVETVNTGGNCMVDLIHLKDGRILGISDDVVALYRSIEQFEEGIDPATGEDSADIEKIIELY